MPQRDIAPPVPHKLDTKEGEKGHTTHVKRWRGKVSNGKRKAHQIMMCSATQLAHAPVRPAAVQVVVPVGHTVKTPKRRYQYTWIVKEVLPEAMRGHLLLFMRTECSCEVLPDILRLARSMRITIGNADGSVAESFRLHAHERHYEGAWFDYVECDVEVARHGLQNMIGECHHLGYLVIPAGPLQGQRRHFVYVERLLADTDGGVRGAVMRIVNPGYDPKDNRRYTADDDRQDHEYTAIILKHLGVRTVEGTQVAGCYLTPSACHGVALLQPGFYVPEANEKQRPDFYFVVNNTLNDLFM